MKSTLQLSNIDLIFTYTVKGEKVTSAKATLLVQNDILVPALDDAVVCLFTSSWLCSLSILACSYHVPICISSYDSGT
jgi:hypothetical protein